MGRVRHALLVAAGGLLLAGGSAAFAASDPPTLQLWHEVGAFSLGESRARIEYQFGPRQEIAGNALTSGLGYRLHGGVVIVTYDSTNHVHSLSVAGTSYYRSSGGFAIGYHLPLGSCHHSHGSCLYSWRGLTYSPGLGMWQGNTAWKKADVRVAVETERGVVTWFSMTKAGTVGHSVPPTEAVRTAIVELVKSTAASGCTRASCRVTYVRLSASDDAYAVVDIYDKTIGGAVLIVRRVGGRWRLAAGPGTSDVGCGTVPAQVLDDLGLNCTTG